MKKVIYMLIIFTLITMLNTPVSAAENTEVTKFSDVSDDAWYAETVYGLVESGVINGFTDNTFRANNTLTVDQFIKMVVTADGNQLQQGTKYWAQPYIDFAISTGIIKQGEFDTYNRPITRGEIARIISRAMRNETIPDNYLMYQSLIEDFASIHDLYREHALRSFVLGIMQGYPDKTFGANKYLTRAEASTVVLRLTDKSKRAVPSISYPAENESFIIPDLRVEYYYTLGAPYYYIIQLYNFKMYLDKGYKVKIECLNYPELNKREMNWGKHWETANWSQYYPIDLHGELYAQYHPWYIDRNFTKFNYIVEMNIKFKVSIDNGKEIRSYYLEAILQDRDFMY